jgi:hypothetical protein
LRKQVANWVSFDKESFTNLGTCWWSHNLTNGVVCVGCAQDHALGLDVSKLSGLKVSKNYNKSSFSSHLLKWNEFSKSRSDFSKGAFAKINLLNVELV